MAHGATDTAVLLNMLDSEVRRLKTSEALRGAEADAADRDTKRMSVLLAVSQRQLAEAQERCESLTRTIAERDKAIEALECRLREATQTSTTLSSDIKYASVKHEDVVRQLQADVTRHERQCSTLNDTIARLRQGVEELQARNEVLESTVSQEQRRAFETKTHLETRLKSTTEELSTLQAMRAKETKDVTSREYDLSRMISQLKQRVMDGDHALDREKRSHTESVVALKGDLERFRSLATQLELRDSERERSATDRLTRMTVELEATKDRCETAMMALKTRETALQAQAATLASNLRATQAEMMVMDEQHKTQVRERSDEILRLSAALAALNSRFEATVAERDRYQHRLQQATLENDTKQNALVRSVQSAENATRQVEVGAAERHDSMLNRFTELSLRFQTSQDALAAQRRLSKEQEEEFDKERSAMKAEIDGLKAAVAMLENHIAEDARVKILKDQNDSLNDEVHRLGGELSKANQKLAALSIQASERETLAIRTLKHALAEREGQISDLKMRLHVLRPPSTPSIPLITEQ